MSFEANKIAAAVLVAMILALVSGILADHLVKPEMLAKNVYVVAGAEPTAATAEAAPAGPEPIEPLLATASVDAGKSDTKVCMACHTFEKGQPNRIGPNLYGIVGDEAAHDRGGYAFSDALKAKGGTWTVDALNDWLFKPQEYAKGTKMTFAGMPKAKDRADVIAYLNSLSDSPKPLPTAAAKPAAAPAAAGQPAATAPPAGQPAAPAPAPVGQPGAPKPQATGK